MPNGDAFGVQGCIGAREPVQCNSGLCMSLHSAYIHFLPIQTVQYLSGQLCRLFVPYAASTIQEWFFLCMAALSLPFFIHVVDTSIFQLAGQVICFLCVQH